MRRLRLEAFKALNSAKVQKSVEFERCFRCWKPANFIDDPDKYTFVTESYHSISFFFFVLGLDASPRFDGLNPHLSGKRPKQAGALRITSVCSRDE